TIVRPDRILGGTSARTALPLTTRATCSAAAAGCGATQAQPPHHQAASAATVANQAKAGRRRQCRRPTGFDERRVANIAGRSSPAARRRAATGSALLRALSTGWGTTLRSRRLRKGCVNQRWQERPYQSAL